MRGVSLIDSFQSSDSRGSFLKILRHEEIKGVQGFELEEVFFTSSAKGTIRGMHLQVDHAANWRFIQVLRGQAFDVLLDLRRDEQTFSQTRINQLSDEKPQTWLLQHAELVDLRKVLWYRIGFFLPKYVVRDLLL